MSVELIDKLCKLKAEESCLKKNIDSNCYDINVRRRLFAKQQKVEKEIKKVNFMLHLEKEMQNANNNTNKSNN